MKRVRTNASDIEEDRLQALKAYSKNRRGQGTSLEATFGPGTHGCHEALHAAHLLAGFVESGLLDHPAIVLNPRWYKRARRAVTELNQLYQDIGAAHLSKIKPEALGTVMERTVIIVKPHAAARGLTGEFLARFERIGLRIAAIKVIAGDRMLWERFYPSDDSWFAAVGGKTTEDAASRGLDVKARLGTDDPGAIGRLVKTWLVDHMASGPAIAAILEGNEAQAKVRTACGATMPNRAVPGTIRFDYSSDSPALANDEKRPVYNLIHASDPAEMRGGQSAAAYEIRVLFPEL